MTSTPNRVLSIGNPDSGSIVSCAVFDDVNNDGYDDAALNNRTPGPINYTDVFIYHGSAEGINTPNQTKRIYVNEIKEYGFSVELYSAGDFSANGYNDLFIGNQWATYNGFDEGEGLIYYGSNSGLNDAALILSNPRGANNSRFGNSADGIGDFNHDGVDDIIIGIFSPLTILYAAC